jgi:zinc protease
MNKTTRQNLVCLLSILFAAGCSTASKTTSDKPEPAKAGAHQVLPLIGSTQVHRYQLDNGMKILVVEDHSSPTFAYTTWFKVGSRDEDPGRTGLAHLFEHMMFKGTSSHKEGEFEKILDAAGAEGSNAFTTKDMTVYVQELPEPKIEGQTPGSLDLIMGLEADRMQNLVVNDEAFKTELEVVQNERRMRYENNPDGLMYQALFATAFQRHPYKWPVIGNTEDLQQMTAEDARRFYKSHYSPDHAILVVSGDVKPDEVYEKAKQHFGSIPASAPVAHTIEAEPPQVSPRRKDMALNLKVEKLMMGYHIPALTSEDIPALGMLQSVLGTGKSSRLNRALVETGIATGVYADQMDDADPTLFMIDVSLQKGKKAAVAESVVLKEIAKVAAQPVSQAELERVRNKLNFNFLDGMDSNSERCHLIGHYEADAGDYQIVLRDYEKMLAVTPAQIQAVAKKYLNPANRTTITGVPK